MQGRWVDATDNRKLTRYIEFLERNTLFAVYLCIRHQFLAKEIHSHHFFDVCHCSTPNRVLDLQKFENGCRLITQDIRAPFDVTCSIPCWMMLTTIRLSKISFFRKCDTAMLRSMQIQDPDNQVSDPTDLAVKPDVNRFRIMMGIVLKC